MRALTAPVFQFTPTSCLSMGPSASTVAAQLGFGGTRPAAFVKVCVAGVITACLQCLQQVAFTGKEQDSVL